MGLCKMPQRITFGIAALCMAGSLTNIALAIAESSAHSQGTWTVITEATCETDGLRQRYCEHCGRMEAEIIPAMGHEWIIWNIEPTYTELGQIISVCSRCGKKTVEEIPRLEPENGPKAAETDLIWGTLEAELQYAAETETQSGAASETQYTAATVEAPRGAQDSQEEKTQEENAADRTETEGGTAEQKTEIYTTKEKDTALKEYGNQAPTEKKTAPMIDEIDAILTAGYTGTLAGGAVLLTPWMRFFRLMKKRKQAAIAEMWRDKNDEG